MSQVFSSSHRIFWTRVFALGVFAYIIFVPAPQLMPLWLSDIVELFGLILLGTAAFGRVWCLVYVAGKKDNVLVTQGPYSVVRNPLYVFSFLGVFGFGLAVENPILSVVLAVAFMLYYRHVVPREEISLVEEFGEPYAEYLRTTPRWVPSLSLYVEPKTLESVNVRAVRQGILQASWFVLGYVIAELIEIGQTAYWG